MASGVHTDMYVLHTVVYVACQGRSPARSGDDRLIAAMDATPSYAGAPACACLTPPQLRSPSTVTLAPRCRPLPIALGSPAAPSTGTSRASRNCSWHS